MSTDKSLEVRGLTASYGSIKALRGVDLKVVQGSVVAVVGRNGAGKSTLLNSICGVMKSDGGTVRFGDRDLTGMSAQRVTRSGLALVPEGRRIIAPLTVRENLGLSKAARRKSDRDMESWVFELFPILKDRAKQYAGSLSGGEQQMLAIGRALMTHPDLIVLDEPSMGLAPFVVDKVYESLISINNTGISVLLVEQDAVLASSVADYMFVMQQGEIVAKGTPDDLTKNDFITSGYFS
ncbi:MAG: ABC transporter ATP-binding protein [Ilumatobacteraceae bacterium]